MPVLESVGVTDVLAKSKGSSNPHNLVKATIMALGEMRDARMIAQNRGISVEKVFRGDRKSTRLNSSHSDRSRMPSSA